MTTAREKLVKKQTAVPARKDMGLRSATKSVGGTLPVTEQAKDVLLGDTKAYDKVDPVLDFIDRLGSNNPRRLRGGTSTGAKPMLRRLLGTSDKELNYPQFTLQELCTLTGKSEVNVRTCLSDLRSPKFAGREGVFITKLVRKSGLSFYEYDPEATMGIQKLAE